MSKLTVNGQMREFDAEPDTPLLWVLREQLGLTGTKYGCGIAQCGACTVQIDGAATRSCVLPLSAVGPDAKIVTIEGLSPSGMHPVQRAWVALDVPQCGYCQSGMIMAAAALLEARSRSPPTPTSTSEMTNICRCGTYNRVRAAIKLAAASVRQAEHGGSTHDTSHRRVSPPQFPRSAPPPPPADWSSASTCRSPAARRRRPQAAPPRSMPGS